MASDDEVDDTPALLVPLAEAIPESLEFHADGTVTATGAAIIPTGVFDDDPELDPDLPAHLTSW